MPTYHLSVVDGRITLDGHTLHLPDGQDIHRLAIQVAAKKAEADHPGQVCLVRAATEDGIWEIYVQSGTVLPEKPATQTETDHQPGALHLVPTTEAEAEPEPIHEPQPEPEPGPEAEPVSKSVDDAPLMFGDTPWPPTREAESVATHKPEPEPARQPEPDPEPAPVNPFLSSFIEPHRASAPQVKPASGFASVLASFGIGGPSNAQQAAAADRYAVSTVWTRPKAIAVANGKGGSGKTPTTIYLASMFAREGGGMVLAYDNNTFRGALGWQTENAEHHATIEDLMNALPTFDPATMRAADMARFTHHQTDDRFDVLQSRPQKLAVDQRLSDDEFDAIQDVVRRYYRLTVFDSGNDESAANWLAMIRHSDALVVPTATTPKHCESARLLLSALTEQGGHSAQLARNAVIVVSHASPNEPAPASVMPMFEGMAREVLAIPHDPAMGKSWLKWADLDAKTQRAWLAVGAAVARGLSD